MKREKFEVKGVVAAKIESRVSPCDGYLAKITEEVEARFFEGARACAKKYCDKVSIMSASERRRVKCRKITLESSVFRDGNLCRVTFGSSMADGGGTVYGGRTVFFDEKDGVLVSRRAPRREREKSGGGPEDI